MLSRLGNRMFLGAALALSAFAGTTFIAPATADAQVVVVRPGRGGYGNPYRYYRGGGPVVVQPGYGQYYQQPRRFNRGYRAPRGYYYPSPYYAPPPAYGYPNYGYPGYGYGR